MRHPAILTLLRKYEYFQNLKTRSAQSFGFPHSDNPRFSGLVRRFNRMGDLEKILPDEIRGSTLWPGNELVLPHAEASSAVGIATEQQIAILGFEAFEVRKDGLLTVDLNDPSAHISFAGDWLAYVVAMNTEADHWIKEHRYAANHGYILTSASKSEFDQIQKLRKTL